MTIDEAIRVLKYNMDMARFNPNTGESAPMNKDCADLGDACEMAIEALRNENDLRNELCLMCGKYVNAHKGACKDCRWENRNE